MKKMFLVAAFCAASLSGVFAETNEELQAACDGGNYDACVDLGQRYYKGTDGLEKDHWKAHEYYDKTCNIGKHPRACYIDGIFHSVGQGSEHNHTRALMSLKMACDGGYEKACKAYDRVLHEEEE